MLSMVKSEDLVTLFLSIKTPAGNFCIMFVKETPILFFNEPNNDLFALLFDVLKETSFFFVSVV